MFVCLFPRPASSCLFPVQSKDNMQVLPKANKDMDGLHWYNTSKQKFTNSAETLRVQLIFICMEFTCKIKLKCQVITCRALKRFAIAIKPL